MVVITPLDTLRMLRFWESAKYNTPEESIVTPASWYNDVLVAGPLSLAELPPTTVEIAPLEKETLRTRELLLSLI
jgi:hypothetical protein